MRHLVRFIRLFTRRLASWLSIVLNPTKALGAAYSRGFQEGLLVGSTGVVLAGVVDDSPVEGFDPKTGKITF